MTISAGISIGNYRLTRELGVGGFAHVWHATHQYLPSKEAAIKFLHAMSREDLENFKAEAASIARLKHQHIVGVHDYGEYQGMPYMVLDFAPNGSLRDLLKHFKSAQAFLPPDYVARYVLEVASAIHYAHGQGIVHRDIKPENLLLNATNGLLVTDFGIATVAHSLASVAATDAVGTVAYMSPEQIKGKPIKRSDQYSLAITAFELLTGELPFSGITQYIIGQHLTADLPSVAAWLPSPIASAVDQVLAIATAKDSEARFSSIWEFGKALNAALLQGKLPSQSTPAAPQRPGTPQSFWPTASPVPAPPAMQQPSPQTPATPAVVSALEQLNAVALASDLVASAHPYANNQEMREWVKVHGYRLTPSILHTKEVVDKLSVSGRYFFTWVRVWCGAQLIRDCIDVIPFQDMLPHLVQDDPYLKNLFQQDSPTRPLLVPQYIAGPYGQYIRTLDEAITQRAKWAAAYPDYATYYKTII